MIVELETGATKVIVIAGNQVAPTGLPAHNAPVVPGRATLRNSSVCPQH